MHWCVKYIYKRQLGRYRGMPPNEYDIYISGIFKLLYVNDNPKELEAFLNKITVHR